MGEGHQDAQWGVIFDWDGVVIDSSRAHEQSWVELAAEEGFDVPIDHFERGFGLRGDTIVKEILGWASDRDEVQRLIDRKEELYRLLIRGTGIEALPGVRALLQSLCEFGIPCAVGSSTPRLNIHCVAELLGLDPFFQAVVSAEDVERGKPHPDVFLLAAERMGIPPERCVVIEDAPAGIEAARRGGMLPVGVSGSHPPEKLSEAHLVVDSLEGMDARRLWSWLEAERGTP